MTQAMTTPAPTPARTAPHRPGLPAVGNILDLWRNPLDLFTEVATIGDVVGLRFAHVRYFLVNSPETAHHVLVDNNRNYTKSPNYKGLKLVLGEGLVTSEGEFWRRQRRLSQPAFHRDRVASFVGAMVDETDRMLARWEERVGDVLDVHAEMMNLTLRIVARTLFSTVVGAEADAIREALGVALHHVNDYAEALIKTPQWLPLPKNFRFRRSLKTLDSLVFRIIDSRRRGENADAGDLLALLMAATEDGRGMTDQQLRDEVMTLVMAGHETTANAMAWTFYLLSKDPEVERRLRRDVAGALSDRAPAAEDAPRLRYARMVIEESMRLFPPVWAIERQAVEDDVVGGCAIPKGGARRDFSLPPPSPRRSTGRTPRGSTRTGSRRIRWRLGRALRTCHSAAGRANASEWGSASSKRRCSSLESCSASVSSSSPAIASRPSRS